MSFLAGSLIKTANPTILVEDCCFAAPLTCDATFQAKYNKLGLRPFTVRYQNEDDIVPFLPWYPVFDLLAAAERMSRPERRNRVVTASVRMRAIHNDYVPIGILRYITTTCDIEYGEKAEHDALKAIEEALLFFEFVTIAEAHSMAGRYYTCICP